VLAVHPFASVTVYECVPAVTTNDPVPVSVPVPPVAPIVTTELPPKQAIGVALELIVIAEG
jgi:hypothetical protein